jgi:PAS domain S-box-containing protein
MLGRGTGARKASMSRDKKSRAPGSRLAELENTLRNALSALGRSEGRFRRLVDAITDYAVFMLDSEGKVRTWNEGARRIKGYRPEEIIGQHFSVFYTPEDRAANRPNEILEAVRREGRFEEERLRVRKDGTRFCANAVITTLRDRRGNLTGFVKVTRDLTARHAAEENERRLEREQAARTASEAGRQELERAEAWLTTTLRSIGDGVIATDTAGRVRMMNLVAERLTGWTEAEATGRTLEDVWPIFSKKTGRRRDPALWARGEARIAAFDEPTVLRSRCGLEIPIDESVAPIGGPNGDPLGAVIVFRDRTRQREAERERERLHEETLAALRARDHFISLASHELRGPLSAVKWRLEALLRAGGATGVSALPAKVRAGVEAAVGQTNKLVRLVTELLDVSRITTGRLRLTIEDVELAGATRGVVARLQEEAQGRLDVRVTAPEPVWGRWDPLYIEVVIDNLISNATKFGRSRPVEVFVSGSPGRAHLVVRDHGIGIAPEVRARLFRRFGRVLTDRKNTGLGMGLYIVCHIVRAHGGSIHVESELGSGSTFDVDLPLDASGRGGQTTTGHGRGPAREGPREPLDE